jgi:hypothetical protein
MKESPNARDPSGVIDTVEEVEEKVENGMKASGYSIKKMVVWLQKTNVDDVCANQKETKTP